MPAVKNQAIGQEELENCRKISKYGKISQNLSKPL